ncbi:MAG: DNA-directed RNA polymerase subunit beta [Prevotella sp.]|nr:DNA-directed RNA polymerase subunit beta [Staphylococcus sp.]MCM1350496.1 DNA-directed RNA polymerase subunit beta [Prevotella sp.]
MSYKNIQYGRTRVRRNYARVQTNVELPNLIEIQTKSFEWFLKDGLASLFKELSPIKDHGDGEKFELHFLDHEFDEPKYSIKEAKIHKVNYSRALKVNVALENKETGEFVEDKIFMGEFPVMTPWGTFIFNGSERVVVTQIVRSAGVFFSEQKDKKSGLSNFSGQIIPTRGAWIEFEKNNKDIWFAKLDRSKKVYLPTFIRALGVKSNPGMISLFVGDDDKIAPRPDKVLKIFQNSFDKDESFGEDDAVRKLYDNLRPGEKTSADTARKFIASRLFEIRRYDLAKVGRYKFNKKLDVVARAVGHRLASDLINQTTGEVILPQGTEITYRKDPITGLSTADILSQNRESLRKTYEYELMLEGNSVVLETLDVLVKTNDGDIKVRILGNDQREERCHVVLSDIFASISYYINLHVGVGKIDDIDHLSNRRLRLIGELLQNQFRMGMMKVEKSVRDKMSTSGEAKSVSAQNLVNIKPLTSTFREFFGSSQLSQFMDQINPLSELTHKRRLSALGQGGISRDRAGFEVRDVHSSHYGRICPVETPEGQNIGLINSLASYARANEFGFIETPYLVVQKDKEHKRAVITDEVKYFTADKEEEFIIAEANVNMGHDPKTGELIILDDKVIARQYGEFIETDKMNVDLVDVSPKQVVAISTACIPFLEHDDTTRALMGANMQRQAIPLLKPEAPFVGTGIEYKAAKDSGVAICADCDGVVEYVDGLNIIVRDAKGTKHTYEMNKYERSNHSTCVNQRPIVVPGEKVKAGDVLADGSSMEQGELALGRNVVIAFMTWNGYNFEDAVIMSERLVQEDVYTSIHIEEYTCEVRDTKLGKEEITRDLDGESKDSIAQLDENGIIRLGAEVKEGDTLVGKVTPKGITEPTPEERLSQALFSDNSKDVRVTSLKVPHGGSGIVHRIERFNRKNGAELPPNVNEVVRVYIVQKRKISEGDKMSGRHGNKGVISNILPIEDMPFMSDGTPIDIMLNPQGVPSRMNIGQVLEIHLGMAAKKLGVHVATPVFDGLTHQDVVDIMNEARQKDEEMAKENPANARAIIDENGKTYLYDGRTGRQFDNKISVGVMYMIKLAHMVDDKLHARSEGPYTLVTQQPMGGKAQNGGQRFGEMEVWALEAYGAAHTLQEMMTIKSDDIIGRNKVYKAIVDGEPLPNPGIPEAFRALIKELQGLGLSVKLVDNDGVDVANKSLVGEFAEAQASKRGL